MEKFNADGSGTVVINICDSQGNIVSTHYKNLSEVAVLEESDGKADE